MDEVREKYWGLKNVKSDSRGWGGAGVRVKFRERVIFLVKVKIWKVDFGSGMEWKWLKKFEKCMDDVREKYWGVKKWKEILGGGEGRELRWNLEKKWYF
jgi:hypothetical protein